MKFEQSISELQSFVALNNSGFFQLQIICLIAADLPRA